jgi:hypothetical protein
MCRSKAILVDGCKVHQLSCPEKTTVCVADQQACDAQTVRVCQGDCDRESAPNDSIFYVHPDEASTIDVSLRHNVPRARITVPAGTFLAPTALRVTLATAGKKGLSTPFRIVAAANGTTSIMMLASTIEAAVDREKFVQTSAVTVQEELVAGQNVTYMPCEYQAAYSSAQFEEGGSPKQCAGTAHISTVGGLSSIKLDIVAYGNGYCVAQNYKITPTMVKLVSTYDKSTLTAEAILATIVTNATSNGTWPWYFRAMRDNNKVTLYTFKDSTKRTAQAPSSLSCVGPANGCQDADQIDSWVLTRDMQAPDMCSLNGGVREIITLDICLAKESVGCLDQRESRLARRYWESPTSSVLKSRMRGRYQTLGTDALFIEAKIPPAQPSPISEATWWQQYGSAASGWIVGFIIFGIVAFFVIWRLYRYRQKYREEKEHLDELQDRVAELDEFAGGLGVADAEDDVDMVANPMVIEMAMLHDQVQVLNNQMSGKAEEDAQEIDHLETERQRLYAEINRVKDEMSKQNAVQIQPTRNIEMTSAAAAPHQSRHQGAAQKKFDFGGGSAKPKKKKMDF